MAKTQTTTKSKYYGEIRKGSHMGFFKWSIAVGNSPLTHSYGYITAPSKEHMDLAILNHINNYGLRKVESITQEEYESKTQI